MADKSRPHWAWPHVIGVAIAIAVYFIVYRFTGDSDLLLALVSGAGGMAASWAYIRYFAFPGTPRS
jgi:hypothetical protein